MYYLIVTRAGVKAKVSKKTFKTFSCNPNTRVHDIKRTKEIYHYNNDGNIVNIEKHDIIIGKVCNLYE